MSFLDKLKTTEAIGNETNSLGGGGLLESGAYDMSIETAYFDTSKGGAMSLNLGFKDASGRTLRQTIYVTSGTAKGCNNYYIDKKSGDKKYLPGFNTANSICLLANGDEISAQEIETKTLMIFDYEARKEVPQQKEVVMTLLGKDVTLGIKKVVENKREQNSAGAWVSASDGSTRTINEIDKVFRTSDHMTTPEIRAEAPEATFYEGWVAKNTGVNRDKSDAKAGEVTGGSSGNSGASADDTPKKSLFG
tara:strand:- start:57 stop:803 length:747 start_codon:yes stop_codon:yes gene_type:complete